MAGSSVSRNLHAGIIALLVFRILEKDRNNYLPKLCELQSLALESTNYEYKSAEYRVTAIILDTAHYRLFRPVRSDIRK